MSWQDPKTEWQTSDLVTAADMQRISGNLAALDPAYAGKTAWAESDYITAADWQAIIEELSALEAVSGVRSPLPTDDLIASNFSALESLTMEIKARFDLIEKNRTAYTYPQAGIYAEADEGLYYTGR